MNKTLPSLIGGASLVAIVVAIVMAASGTKEVVSCLVDGRTEHPSYTQRITDGGWRFGAANATKLVTEYADFQCPACGYVYPIVAQVKKDLPENTALLYKHFPLEERHNKALTAAIASEAAGRQGKFWEMSDMIFSRQASWKDQTPKEFTATVTGYAAEISLNDEWFQCDLKDTDLRERVKTDQKEGLAAKVTGTPTFLIGKTSFGSNLPKNSNELLAWIAATAQ